MFHTLKRTDQDYCASLAIKIEELRKDRYDDALHYPRPDMRRFTQEELCDVAYGSYKALLNKMLQRPPSRRVILNIAEYLECNLKELNTLLREAGYEPELQDMEGAVLTQALEFAEQACRALPYPALVLTRDWNIHHLNGLILQILGLSREEITQLYLPYRLNILRLLFTCEPRLYRYSDQYSPTWEGFARWNIYLFKLSNQLCRYDRWYRDLVASLMALPKFANYWEMIQIETYQEPSPLLVHVPAPGNASITMRTLRILLDSNDFPQVWAFPTI